MNFNDTLSANATTMNEDINSITNSGVEIVATTINSSDIIDDVFDEAEAELSLSGNNDGEDEDTPSQTYRMTKSKKSFFFDVDTTRAGCKKVVLVSLITLLLSVAVTGIVGVGVTSTSNNRIFSGSSVVVTNAKSSKGPKSSKSSKAPKAGGDGYYELVGNGYCIDSQGEFFSGAVLESGGDNSLCPTTCGNCVKGSMVPEEAFRGYSVFYDQCFCSFDLPLLGDNYDFSGSPCTPLLMVTDKYGTGPISEADGGIPFPCYRWVSG